MHSINSHFFGPSGIPCLFAADDDGNTEVGYITKQVGTRRYVVTNGVVTKTCTLARLESDVASEATMPVGLCTFLLSAFESLVVEHVHYLTATRCSTIEGNLYAWHLGDATETVAQITVPAPPLTTNLLARVMMDNATGAFYDGISGTYKIVDTGSGSRAFCWNFGDGTDLSIFQDHASGDRGMVFDGISRIAERTYDAGINDTQWGNNTLTGMIRFQTTTLTSVADRILLAVATAWSIYIDPDGLIKVRLEHDTPPGNSVVNSGINVASDVVYDVAFTCSTVTEEFHLYVNGVEVGTPIIDLTFSGLSTGLLRPENVPLTIGGIFSLSYPIGTKLFGGTIWDVKTYSTALSASTIAYLHDHRELGETPFV